MLFNPQPCWVYSGASAYQDHYGHVFLAYYPKTGSHRLWMLVHPPTRRLFEPEDRVQRAFSTASSTRIISRTHFGKEKPCSISLRSR